MHARYNHHGQFTNRIAEQSKTINQNTCLPFIKPSFHIRSDVTGPIYPLMAHARPILAGPAKYIGISYLVCLSSPGVADKWKLIGFISLSFLREE